MNDSYGYQPIPYAVIQIEALFDFITDIVLRDQVIVDEAFCYAWKDYNSPLVTLENAGLVRTFPFLSRPKKLDVVRSEIFGVRVKIVHYSALNNSHQYSLHIPQVLSTVFRQVRKMISLHLHIRRKYVYLYV